MFFLKKILIKPTPRPLNLKNYFKYILLFSKKYIWLKNTKKIQKQLPLKSTKRVWLEMLKSHCFYSC